MGIHFAPSENRLVLLAEKKKDGLILYKGVCTAVAKMDNSSASIIKLQVQLAALAILLPHICLKCILVPQYEL